MNNRHSIYKIGLLGFITGLANGLFGSGGGTVLVPSLIYLFCIEDHKAHATAIAVILPLSIISSFIYYKANIFNVSLTAKIAIASMAGAFVGSMLLNRISILWLRKIFGTFMIIAAIRMVL